MNVIRIQAVGTTTSGHRSLISCRAQVACSALLATMLAVTQCADAIGQVAESHGSTAPSAYMVVGDRNDAVAERIPVTVTAGSVDTASAEGLPRPDSLPSVKGAHETRSAMPFGHSLVSQRDSRAKSKWINPYISRAEQTPPTEQPVATELPEFFGVSSVDGPWWQARVGETLFHSSRPMPVDVSSLMYTALQYSPTVSAISRTPLIHEYTIIESDAAFDMTSFVESKFLDLSEPIGSDLTAGGPAGPARFRDHDWDFKAGIRKRTYTGSQLEFSQEMGYQDNNSVFFNPTQQRTARLSLRFTQPLLQGRGRVYNTGLTVLAKLETGVAWAQFSEQLQDHLLDVTHAYWRLYHGRAALLQRQQHLERAKAILAELDARLNIDATHSQVAMAQAAVTDRATALVRAEMTIRDAQTRLRSLVTSPELKYEQDLELIPVEMPSLAHVVLDTRDALLTAIQHRPDVDAAFRQVQAAGVRLKMAKNELLPIFNFVMDSYIGGLRGEEGLGRAWEDQFAVGEPTYSVGLVYEMPLGNRAAASRLKRRKLELRQMIDQFNSRIEILMSEVEIAVRRVNTSYRTVLSTHQALVAADKELYALSERWKHLPNDRQTASSSLENLLNSQTRLADAELSLLDARIAYALSFYELNRTLGTLLDAEQVSHERVRDCGIPELKFNTPPLEATGSRTPTLESFGLRQTESVR